MADHAETIEMSPYHEPVDSIHSDGGPQTGLRFVIARSHTTSTMLTASRPDLKERHVNMIGFSMVLGM